LRLYKKNPLLPRVIQGSRETEYASLVKLSSSFCLGETLLVILLIDLIAGWLAGQIVQGTGFGIVADIVIGIIGAFISETILC